MTVERSDDTVPLAELLAERAFLRRLARVLVRDESRAEDLEQEAWLCAMRSPPRRTGSVRAWLGQVLRNLARNQRRGEVRVERREREAARSGPAPGAEDVFRRADTHRRVVAAVFTLEEPYRSTLLLRHFEGLSFPEIAARMGTTADAARMRANRAAALLRERLDEAHGGDRALWCAALAELIRDPRRPAAAAAAAGTGATVGALAGGALVATKTKVAISVLFLLLLAGAVVLSSRPERSERAPTPRAADVATGAGAEPEAAPADAGAEVADAAGTPAPEEAADGSWTLEGRVLDPEGRPVAGATIACFAGPSTKGRSGPDGGFLVEVEPGRKGRVLAVAGGFAAVSVDFTAGAAGESGPLDVRLRPEFRISGRVLTDRGDPLAGATVAAGVAPATETRADGTFTLLHLDRTLPLQLLSASRAGWVRGTAAVRTAGESAEVEFVLARGATLRGRVTDAGGAPVADAVVRVWPWLDGRHSVAEDGTFEIPGVDQGPARLEVTAPGFATGVREVEVPTSGLVEGLDVRLDAGRVVRGTVRNADGDPVPGALVWFRAGPTVLAVKANCDDSGHFEIARVPTGDVTLLAASAGYLTGTEDLPPQGPVDLDVVLPEAAGFAGRVVDAASGEPVTRFAVKLAPLSRRRKEGEAIATGFPPPWTYDAGRGAVFSSPDGVFRTGDWCAVGSLASFEITAEGYAPAVVANLAAAVDPDPRALVIRLEPGVRLEGLVVDAKTGRPVEGAVVRVTTRRNSARLGYGRDGPAELRTTTGAAGRFTFPHRRPEFVRLVVTHAEYAIGFGEWIDLRDGPPAEPVRISLDGGAVIEGVVLGDDGNPLAGADVVLTGPQPSPIPPLSLPVVSDGEGRFVFRRVAAGRYSVGHRVAVGTGRYDRISRSLEVRTGDRAEVVLGPDGTGSVRGRVEAEGADGAAWTASLRTIDSTPESRRTKRLPGTGFAFAGLAPGRYRVAVYGRSEGGSWYGEQDVELSEGGSADVTVHAARRR